MGNVAQRLPFTYTGADFYALCSDAMLKAVTRQSTAVDAKIRTINTEQRAGKPEISTAYFFDHYATKDDIAVMVTEADFMAAHEELVPSVSAGELAHYEKVRASFEGSRDKQQQHQHQQRPSYPSPLGGGGRSKLHVKTQGRVPSSSSSKGKGKAVATDAYSDEEDSDRTPVGIANGRGKGKGKAVMGFQDSTADDDEDLY